MIQRTHSCSQFGHPEFSLVCVDQEAFVPRIQWLLDWLADSVAKGRRFLPDQNVQVGWSLLKVKQREDGTLALFEPDFETMPAKFVDTVSNALRHLLLHKCVCESVGLDDKMILPALQDSAIICSELGKHNELILTREAIAGADSGWFFGCGNPSHNHQSAENLRRVSLYEAVVLFDQRVLPYLALPPGILVSTTDSKLRFFINEVELAIKPGSYLDRKLKQQRI